MTLNQAKKEAWKNQIPVILKVDGSDEYVWMPRVLFNSNKGKQGIIGLTLAYKWVDNKWRKVKFN